VDIMKPVLLVLLVLILVLIVLDLLHPVNLVLQQPIESLPLIVLVKMDFMKLVLNVQPVIKQFVQNALARHNHVLLIAIQVVLLVIHQVNVLPVPLDNLLMKTVLATNVIKLYAQLAQDPLLHV